MDRFLVLLLTFLIAKAAPNATGPDVDGIINQVDKLLQFFDSFTYNTTWLQRLEDVKEDKAGVTGFFDMLGDLFTNGTIGYFEDEHAGQDAVPRLYVNTNGTSGKLSEKLVQLFNELSLYDMFDTWLNDMLLPNDGSNDVALQAIRTAFRGIFARSMAFDEELIGATAAQIRLQYPFEDEEVDGNRCYMSRLDELCSALGWTQNASVVAYTMQSLLRIMGPGCETEIIDDPYLHALQLNTNDIAKMSNFSGGDSNRCFHKFLLRYHNYSKQAYDDRFITNLEYYLYEERAIYGFCARLLQARDNVAAPSEPTITEQITTLLKSLLEARCILTEKVSSCPTKETSTIPAWLPSKEASNSASMSSRSTRSPLTSTDRTSPTTTMSPSTQEPNDTRQWNVIARNAAERAIGNKSFEYPTSVSAVETYRAVGMLMIALLKQSNGSRNLYDYKALVFYPANDDSEYCIRNGTEGDLYSSMHNNVRFILARYDRSQLVNITERVKQAGWLCSYCEVDTENQCDRLQVMGRTVDAALRKFRALIAIKCARKFVWYELGYRYFQAAWTNAVAIPTSHPSANEYSHKCGNTVVFP